MASGLRKAERLSTYLRRGSCNHDSHNQRQEESLDSLQRQLEEKQAAFDALAMRMDIRMNVANSLCERLESLGVAGNLDEILKRPHENQRTGEREEQDNSLQDANTVMQGVYNSMATLKYYFDQKLELLRMAVEDKVEHVLDKAENAAQTAEWLNTRVADMDETVIRLEERLDSSLRRPELESPHKRRPAAETSAHATTNQHGSWDVSIVLVPDRFQKFAFRPGESLYRECTSRGFHQDLLLKDHTYETFVLDVETAFGALLHGRPWMPLRCLRSSDMSLDQLDRSEIDHKLWNYAFLESQCMAFDKSRGKDIIYITLQHETLSWEKIENLPRIFGGDDSCRNHDDNPNGPYNENAVLDRKMSTYSIVSEAAIKATESPSLSPKPDDSGIDPAYEPLPPYSIRSIDEPERLYGDISPGKLADGVGDPTITSRRSLSPAPTPRPQMMYYSGRCKRKIPVAVKEPMKLKYSSMKLAWRPRYQTGHRSMESLPEEPNSGDSYPKSTPHRSSPIPPSAGRWTVEAQRVLKVEDNKDAGISGASDDTTNALDYPSSEDDDGDFSDEIFSGNSSAKSSIWYEQPTVPEREAALSSCMDRSRNMVVDHLMNDLSSLLGYDRQGTSGKGCTESNNSQYSKSSGNAAQAQQPNHQQQGQQCGDRTRKRPNASGNGDDGAGNESDDGDRRDSKRSRLLAVEFSLPQMQKLACPYAQRNPAAHQKFKSCISPGFVSVHRLKEHLYRRHALPIHCSRCCKTFDKDLGLADHLRQDERCEKQDMEPLEGFTKDQERRLRSRKRSAGSEVEKWREVYSILFPDDTLDVMPSPYCVPRGATQSELLRLRQDDLSLFEDYQRQELPRRVRKRLDHLVQRNSLALEEHLRAQLVDIVRECQSELFQSYQKPSDPHAGSSRMTESGASHLNGSQASSSANELAAYRTIEPVADSALLMDPHIMEPSFAGTGDIELTSDIPTSEFCPSMFDSNYDPFTAEPWHTPATALTEAEAETGDEFEKMCEGS